MPGPVCPIPESMYRLFPLPMEICTWLTPSSPSSLCSHVTFSTRPSMIILFKISILSLTALLYTFSNSIFHLLTKCIIYFHTMFIFYFTPLLPPNQNVSTLRAGILSQFFSLMYLNHLKQCLTQ